MKNTAYVVFDDAMLDFYESSLPILKEQNVPVTVFVATEPVTKGNTIWNYQLFDFFLNTLFTEFELEIDNNIYRFKKDRNYYQDVMVFHQKMLHKSPDEISKLFDFISKQLEVEEINNFAPVCSWSHLTQISNLEIDLQAHTHSHSYLPKQSAEVMNKEFSLSKKEIKTKIGIETAMIAYPNGGYNNQVIELARKYFSYGFSVDEKFVNLNRLNDPIYRMIIPRFNVHDQCAEEILLRTFGFHKMLRNIKSSIGL
ncbi:MAG: polysaccharide deacetylase family protein [Fulvivirga sp.]|uniref:polysaccharide deacetylase family protein n=1 Tax=Fulvivirga sp. TaxID=1931237 RepID=UPI0032ED33D4